MVSGIIGCKVQNYILYGRKNEIWIMMDYNLPVDNMAIEINMEEFWSKHFGF